MLPDYQKFGYGIESASLLLKFGFQNLKAHKIVGMCNSENLGSSRIMQKVGMCREEFSEKNCFGMGNGLTNIFFSILDKEYFYNK
ncbi:GNAT family N-acetyltransferase [Clostridium sp. D2Q-11]|uniref:GNAT family N-acetyltransferase n=1 Tax=Anaeromonas frigoriresistens TaxID=2683708 RepID=A0A942UTJ9_9FIRM|nr:GNAT family N-acetyltransferase [Anaeromonas frigoriresistens]